ncbi:uncharacterized protein CXorf51A [Felis catus]|uniref:uncharacterized protein CXorf51A n=1 Tax=Felis catus TaxID=9685 RepID=UPI0003F1BE93|nr:uncharacterized protein CXorf51A [Felis catus]
MGKVTRKLPQPDTDTDMDQQTSSSNEKMTTPYQPRSRDGSKVLKTTIKVKRPIKKSLNKKVLNKTTNSVRRPKKARGTILFGHYHRLNERLNQREQDQDQDQDQDQGQGQGQDQENVEKATTSSDDLASQ